MELLAALLLGPIVSPFLRKPLQGWLILGVAAVVALLCLVSGMLLRPSEASYSWFLWAGLGVVGCISVGVTNVVRFRPSAEPETPGPQPAMSPPPDRILNRRQRRKGRKR